MRRPSSPLLALLVAALVAALGATVPDGQHGEPPSAEPAAAEGGAVLVGAGDIAGCGWQGDEATARLLDQIDGIVFTLGDNAYPSGRPAEFARCYEPSWGRHRHRTRPVLGSREYQTAGAAGHFDYFGAAAGPRGRGWYTYRVGAHWQAIVLNSECSEVGGCGLGSPQARWLQRVLSENRDRHIIAFWHRPRFSSGINGPDPRSQVFWDLLYAHGAELVLHANDHAYERFARQDPRGRADPRRGIRQFTVGTGGAPLYPRAVDQVLDRLGPLRHLAAGLREPNSELFSNSSHGVLKLTLRESSYSWEFVPAAGSSLRDSGTAATH
jgi:acid phosphatase type 7